MSSNNHQSLNYPFLLLTHLVCADREIHNKELNHLQILVEKKGINEETLNEKEKILTQDESLLSIETVAKQISSQEQNAVMGDLLLMAFADGYFSPLERQMLQQVREIWNWSSEQLENFIQSANEFQEAQENYFSTLHQVTKLEGHLWNDPDYQNGIKQSAIISHEDYPFAKDSLENTEAKLKELEEKLDKTLTEIQNQINQQAKAETAKEVINLLDETIQHLKDEIQTKLIAVQDSLEAKKSSLDYFTIAFMGKTKAGKSTLHSILTEQGWSAIGAGKQRTTRLNRVYEWKNIRIIDTPGIGAPGGKTDEEIAQSIINKADLVVFVVTNDSQQESEFKFLKLLKENAKPLCILLNVRKNLNDSRRGEYELKRFLKNPEKLFNDKEIQGHFNRIRGYAEKYYGNDYFPIVPVMLLAAQLSYEEKHEHHKDQLWKASRIENFLEQIRLSVVEQGAIRRSQNLLGSTVKVIEEANTWAKEQATPYHALAEEIQNKQEKLKQDINEAIQEAEQDLKVDIKGLFQEIRDKIPQFAEFHWEDSKKEFNQAAEKLIKDLKCQEKLENHAEENWHEFINKVQHILDELGQNLIFKAELGGIKGFDFDYDKGFEFKNFFQFLGGFFAIIGGFGFFFPPLFFLEVIGIVMGLIANLFKSKKKRREQKVAEITKLFNQELDKQEKDITKQVIAKFRENCNQVKREVEMYLNLLENGLEMISQNFQAVEAKLNKEVNLLNCAYGKRIIDWSRKYYEPLSQGAINREVISVTREIGKSIVIKGKNCFYVYRYQEELDTILQEKVFLDIPKLQDLVNKKLDDYIPILNKVLEEERWKDAEEITFQILLNLTDFTHPSILKDKNIINFPFQILQNIEELWRNNSNWEYGLKIEQNNYQSLDGTYLASWYKVGINRQQDNQFFFPIFSQFYIVNFDEINSLDTKEKLINLKTEWEIKKKHHNDAMFKIKQIQQLILHYVNEEKKDLAQISQLNLSNYQKTAEQNKLELERLMKEADQLFFY